MIDGCVDEVVRGVGAVCVCFCKQKAAYELRISDWSSDVSSSDLLDNGQAWPRIILPSGPTPVIRPHRSPRSSPAGASPRAPRPSCTDVRDKLGRASCREGVCQYV